MYGIARPDAGRWAGAKGFPGIGESEIDLVSILRYNIMKLCKQIIPTFGELYFGNRGKGSV